MQIDVMPIVRRACDLCNDEVTDENHTATKSFILTDWGVICIKCWDDRIEGHAEFEIVDEGAEKQKSSSWQTVLGTFVLLISG